MFKIVRDEEGNHLVHGNPWQPAGLHLYRKKTLTAAVMMIEPFSVETLEGTMEGKAGDWLMVGANGEMYPCDHDIFATTYTLVGSRDDVPPAQADTTLSTLRAKNKQMRTAILEAIDMLETTGAHRWIYWREKVRKELL